MEAIPKTAPICPIFNRFRLWIKQKFRKNWYIFVVYTDRRAIDIVSIFSPLKKNNVVVEIFSFECMAMFGQICHHG